MSNPWFVINILLLRITWLYGHLGANSLIPSPYPHGSQVKKLSYFFQFIEELSIEELSIEEIKNELVKLKKDLEIDVDIYTEEKISLSKHHVLEMAKLYFPTSDNAYLKGQRPEIKINYTPRHFVCSMFLHQSCQDARFYQDKLCKKWEYIWDAQVEDYDEKVQLFKQILSLPCLDRLGRDW